MSANESTWSIIRRGAAQSPALVAGLRSSIGVALASALGRVVVPVAIHQILDRGVFGGFRPGFVAVTSLLAAAAVVALLVINRWTSIRLVTYAQRFLAGLRTDSFEHVHRLSIAHHADTTRGDLVSRITSDVVTLSMFAQWGAMSWIVNSVTVVVLFVVLAFYSWQLALVALVMLGPMVPLIRLLQRRQLVAYGKQRSAVGDTLGLIGEAVGGAAVVRAYNLQGVMRRRLLGAVDTQFAASRRASWFVGTLFSITDVVGVVTVAAVIGIGAWWGPGWGLSAGSVVASVFLVNLLLGPIGELGEVLDQTQQAMAGWRRILDLLDTPVGVVEPAPGRDLPSGPLSVELAGVGFSYLPDLPVLSEVTASVPAGASVAVVGETGSGKSTLVSLLCRLADPVTGRVLVGGLPLPEVAAASRQRAIRLVPQDGFLFDRSVLENVRLGRRDATDDDVLAAFAELGLVDWVESLPDGLATRVGERGSALSVGERQLVALARAQLSDAGLLILDEATSSVDAETERALSVAMIRVSQGRTTLSVAHRLSTAEAADVVWVFDAGRLVQVGSHGELVAQAGRYRDLYGSWLGNTRERRVAGE